MLIEYRRVASPLRNVMREANLNAQRFNHRSIDTGHVLLAAVNNAEVPVASALGLSSLDSLDLEARFLQLRPTGPAYVLMGKLPQTDDLRGAIEFAFREAIRSGHVFVDSEHELLGILSGNGIAVRVLADLGFDVATMRCDLGRLISNR